MGVDRYMMFSHVSKWKFSPVVRRIVLSKGCTLHLAKPLHGLAFYDTVHRHCSGEVLGRVQPPGTGVPLTPN